MSSAAFTPTRSSQSAHRQTTDLVPQKNFSEVDFADEPQHTDLHYPTNDWVLVTDLNAVLLEASESLCRKLGYMFGELEGLHISALDTGWPKVRLSRLLTAAQKGTVTIESRYRCKEGALLDLELSVVNVSMNGQECLRFACRDITERRRAEQELSIAAVAFEAHESMLVTDSKLTILRVNQAYSEDSGYSSQEVIGETLMALRPSGEPPTVHEEMWRRIASDGYWRGETSSRRKNGEVYPAWITITSVKDGTGAVTNYVVTLVDITHRKAAEREIRDLAFLDPLTKLGNRRQLLDRLQQALATNSATGECGAIAFIDLDHFKALNDSAGHEVGDMLLQQVAKRLRESVRPVDSIARFGGDEFVVLLSGLGCNTDSAEALAREMAQAMLSSLNAPYELLGRVHVSSPSIGVTLFGPEFQTTAELLRRADVAMYHAKANGRNTVRFYHPDLQTAINSRKELEGAMVAALHKGEFVLHYQPQVSTDGRVIGAEALLRWHHPERGLLMPEAFMAVAEESGLIVPIGLYILELACRQLVTWTSEHQLPDFSMSVNVSARQFRHPDFLAHVLTTLTRTGADPRKLTLELTESQMVEDVDDTIAKMCELRSHGVGFSLDDFGTGYSSLSLLKKLPLDQLKIDQSFVEGLHQGSDDIVQMVILLCRSMGLDMIAEGVETEEQRMFLSISGCGAYQGHLFGRPMTAHGFNAYLEGNGDREELSGETEVGLDQRDLRLEVFGATDTSLAANTSLIALRT